ncbi:hypothetical protein [Myroides odoratimimus]|uniref:hypothetical protein n=1 Tax=Myroides odoratimimus TaxID=76832 RepID=UPI002576098F|nr:hypothetical protein [Myroides odoratimimus]MDM1536396.1 hypothetical protein [Myroides odoratimimus]MDM1676060.1 hypothetical protein [Myroides odoratimimus]
MAIEKLNIEKKKDNPTRISQIVKANLPPVEYIRSTEFNAVVDKVNEIIPEVNAGVTGYQGKIYPTDKKDAIGFYFAAESGVYPYAGNFTINIAEGINHLMFDGTKWDKMLTPIEATGKVEEGNKGIVAGGIVYSKIEEFYNETENLLNNQDITGGQYVVSNSTNKVVLGNAVNWISIRIPVKGNTQYHLQDIMSFSGKDINTVLFSDIDEYFISALKGTEEYKTFITPENCRFVYLPLQNKIDIGNNPTSSIYYNTALMCLGSKDIEYVPYGFNLKENKIPSLDNTKIRNLDSAIENNKSVLNIKSDLDVLLNSYNKLYRFKGNSKAKLDKEYTLKENGDYLEINFRLYSSWSSFNDSLGIIGRGNTPRDVIGFYNKETIWVRTSTKDIIFTDIPVNPYDFHSYKFKIEDGFLYLYIDNVFFKKELISESIRLINVGDAYTASPKFELQYIIINNELKELTQLENVEVFLEEKNPNFIEHSFNGYYEYTPSDTNGDRCIVYTKLEGTKDLFIGFYVYAFIKEDPIEYSNQIRIQGASVYKYMNSAMINTGYKALVPSESEFTLLQNGKADHTGGVHGDEIALSYKFMPNGKSIELGTKIDLTPCEYFVYIQTSNLHETANAKTPNEPIDGHPIIATHFKRTIFKDSEYITQNIVGYLKEIPVVRAYTGLVCMHKDFASKGYNEYGDYSEFSDKDNSQKLTSQYSKTFYGNGDFGSCEITSELVAVHKPNKKFCQTEEPYKSSNQMWITDRVNDSKYYRLIGGTSGFITTEIGEIWSLECKVKFSK